MFDAITCADVRERDRRPHLLRDGGRRARPRAPAAGASSARHRDRRARPASCAATGPRSNASRARPRPRGRRRPRAPSGTRPTTASVCGETTSIVASLRAGTQSPPMKSRSCVCMGVRGCLATPATSTRVHAPETSEPHRPARWPRRARRRASPRRAPSKAARAARRLALTAELLSEDRDRHDDEQAERAHPCLDRRHRLGAPFGREPALAVAADSRARPASRDRARRRTKTSTMKREDPRLQATKSRARRSTRSACRRRRSAPRRVRAARRGSPTSGRSRRRDEHGGGAQESHDVPPGPRAPDPSGLAEQYPALRRGFACRRSEKGPLPWPGTSRPSRIFRRSSTGWTRFVRDEVEPLDLAFREPARRLRSPEPGLQADHRPAEGGGEAARPVGLPPRPGPRRPRLRPAEARAHERDPRPLELGAERLRLPGARLRQRRDPRALRHARAEASATCSRSSTATSSPASR